MTNTTLTTIVLGASLAGLSLFTGWQLMGGWAIVLLTGFLAAVGFSAWRSGGRIAVAGARRLQPYEAPSLFDTVERLSRRAGLANPPELYYVRNRLINAATVGTPDHAILLVTDGILSALPSRELEAVLAHEIAHIKNRDLSLFRLAEVFRQATLVFARTGWLIVLFALPLLLASGGIAPGALLALFAAPFASWLLQLGLLRTREFAADETAAALTGDPEGLARALTRIEFAQRSILEVFLPVANRSEGSLFRTHPPTEQRVERLRARSFCFTHPREFSIKDPCHSTSINASRAESSANTWWASEAINPISPVPHADP